MGKSTVDKIFESLTAEDDGRVCKDIPESACHEQPRNFVTHILSLSMTKTADGLIDPKLVLSWILTTLGGSSFICRVACTGSGSWRVIATTFYRRLYKIFTSEEMGLGSW